MYINYINMVHMLFGTYGLHVPAHIVSRLWKCGSLVLVPTPHSLGLDKLLSTILSVTSLPVSGSELPYEFTSGQGTEPVCCHVHTRQRHQISFVLSQ